MPKIGETKVELVLGRPKVALQHRNPADDEACPEPRVAGNGFLGYYCVCGKNMSWLPARSKIVEAQAAAPEQDEAVPDAPEEHLDSNGEPYICNCPFHLASPPPVPAALDVEQAFVKGWFAALLYAIDEGGDPTSSEEARRQAAEYARLSHQSEDNT